MKAALDRGANFWNGAEYYGPPTANSLHLLNHYFTTYPEDSKKIILSIKGAFSISGPDNSPAAIQKSVENCLQFWTARSSLTSFSPDASTQKYQLRRLCARLRSTSRPARLAGMVLANVVPRPSDVRMLCTLSRLLKWNYRCSLRTC